MSAIFRPRRASGKPLPPNSNNTSAKFPRSPNVKSWQGGSGEAPFLGSAKSAVLASSSSGHQNQSRRPSDATIISTSSSKSSCLRKASQVPESAECRRLRREPTFISTELSLTVSDRRLSDASGTLYRASSGNIMLLGHLGNLKQQGTKNSSAHHKTVRETLITGNIMRKPSGKNQQFQNMFGGLMNKLDPEILKSAGNDKYKQGRFEEALALYNQAIALDSNKASYHSNKSAALIGLGRLMEAVFECREATRIEPSYRRAHHRLATLYLRLGEAEKAMHHYRQAGPKADSEDIAKAQALKTHLTRCTKATELRDWNSLLKDSQSAISSGADSAPQIHAMQVDALLKLHRHQEAYDIFQRGPDLDIDSSSRFFGPACGAYLLTIRAQVFMVAGRFEDALAAARQAARLDSSSEVNAVVKKFQAMAFARSNGNRLFMASKFSEASVAYSEGLERNPYNPILLCNRAACRAKLGQFEKAAEDCTAALNVRPSYSKARLRRANCNARLERWEAAIQDYEMLVQETPGDEEMGKALFEAQVQLKKQRCEDTKDMKFGSDLVFN